MIYSKQDIIPKDSFIVFSSMFFEIRWSYIECWYDMLKFARKNILYINNFLFLLKHFYRIGCDDRLIYFRCMKFCINLISVWANISSLLIITVKLNFIFIHSTLVFRNSLILSAIFLINKAWKWNRISFLISYSTFLVG